MEELIMTKQLVTYIMGGMRFIDELRALDDVGVDYVEVGIPFSDPVADGPTIMQAGQEAIQDQMTTQKIFDALKSVKDDVKTRIVLMTYYHSIETYGEAAFIQTAEEAGVYGLIIPDMPHEYIVQLKEKYPKRQIKLISLIAMTANQERRETIARQAEGFIYTVTMNEVTGQNGTFHPELKAHIQDIKKIAKVPVFAGFGIRTPAHVQSITEVADGVVVGSEIVKRFKQEGIAQTKAYVQSLCDVLN